MSSSSGRYAVNQSKTNINHSADVDRLKYDDGRGKVKVAPPPPNECDDFVEPYEPLRPARQLLLEKERRSAFSSSLDSTLQPRTLKSSNQR
jgi:hypothetical protein